VGYGETSEEKSPDGASFDGGLTPSMSFVKRDFFATENGLEKDGCWPEENGHHARGIHRHCHSRSGRKRVVSALRRLLGKVFNLSGEPAPEWVAFFNEAWDETEFFPKRHARIENHQLIFVCLEDEVNGEQMAGVVAAMHTANQLYRQCLHEKG
jgi:hypothetical protein